MVSAGQYGTNLNQLKFQVNDAGEVVAKSQAILPLATDVDGSGPGTTFVPNYPVDQPTKEIVDDAVAVANELGAQELGEIGGPFYRAKLADGTTENRGGESTLGNLVAEIQRWATETPEAGAAQIAFMNPGGLRADLVGTGSGSPRTVTYRQAATVQPFANTLVNMDLTGAQIEQVLEEQWQPAGSSRPFLRLGTSEGFSYTYVPPAAGAPAGTKGEVTGMWLDGDPITDAGVYSVTVNSFLAAGGDGFTTLGQGAGKQDTGKTDLQAQVDYFAEFASTEPLPVAPSLAQRSVGVTFPASAPATYAPGGTVAFDVSSFSMTGPGDLKDTEVVVELDGDELGSFPLTNTVQPALPGFDESGTASVSVTLPAGLAPGEHDLVLIGATTGTSVPVPITVASTTPPKVTPTMNVSHSRRDGAGGTHPGRHHRRRAAGRRQRHGPRAVRGRGSGHERAEPGERAGLAAARPVRHPRRQADRGHLPRQRDDPTGERAVLHPGREVAPPGPSQCVDVRSSRSRFRLFTTCSASGRRRWRPPSP